MRGLPRQMLAAPETDFKPDIGNRPLATAEQAARREMVQAGPGIDLDRRQQIFDKRLLTRPERPAGPASIKDPAAGRLFRGAQETSAFRTPPL